MQVKTFEQLEQILFDFLRLIYNCFYGGGDINVFYNLFPLTMVLSHWVFLVGFLTRQIIAHSKRYCTLFPSLEIFPTRFYFSKVLMRHILNGHSRGSVININSGCPNSKWVNESY